MVKAEQVLPLLSLNKEHKIIIVSACLCGINCKYNGFNNFREDIVNLAKRYQLLPICPEQLGGMPTPRDPHEITGGTGKEVLRGKANVISKYGKDSTLYFIKGAEEALRIAKMFNIKDAVLKAKSPSCGLNSIYDGSFSGGKKEGNGVMAELFLQNGINIYTDDEIEKFLNIFK